jgi:hypothetical protein
VAFPESKGANPEYGKEVDALQRKLKRNLNNEIHSDESKSSLQLTSENKKAREATDRYTNKLSSILDGKEDAIGFCIRDQRQV